MRKVLVVVGAYSEAILMAPLVHRLREEPALQTVVHVTAPQHRMLRQTLGIFGIRPDEGSGPIGREADTSISQDVDRAIREHKPDCVFVQGDTSAATESSCLHTGHPAAGLRLHELRYIGQEEGGDGCGPVLSTTHFFVTSAESRDNLLKQGVAADRIYPSGSMAVEALQLAVGRIRGDAALKAGLAASFPSLDPDKRLLLVIGHRRENHGGGLESVCRALRRLAMRADVQVVYPAPLNPAVRGVVEGVFAAHPNIILIEPQDYLHMVYLMLDAYLVLADAGATPEEVLSLGKPVLVMRNVTEPREAIDAGTVRLVGSDTARILLECETFLDDESYYRAFSTHRPPHGDLLSSQDIVEMLLR